MDKKSELERLKDKNKGRVFGDEELRNEIFLLAIDVLISIDGTLVDVKQQLEMFNEQNKLGGR